MKITPSHRILATGIAALFTAVFPARAATFTWGFDASGNWNSSSPTTGWNAAGAFPSAAGDIAIFDRTLTAGRTITMNVAGTVGALTLKTLSNPNNWTIGGASVLTFDSTSGPATILVNGGGTVAALAGNITITAPVTLNDNLSVNVEDMASQFTIGTTGALNANGNTLSLVGPGAFTLSASTITNLGGITVGATQRNITISGVNTRAAGDYTLSLRNLGDFLQSGAATLTSGSVIVNAENLGRALISGALSGTNLTVNGTGAYNRTIEAGGSGTSVLEKSALRLSGNNAFTGTTAINGAAVLMDFTTANAANSKLGTGALTLNNSVLAVNSNTTAASSQTVASTAVTARSGNQITVNRATGAFATTLNLGAITAGAESWASFRTIPTAGTTFIQTSNSNVNGILGAWATLATAAPGYTSGDAITWAAVTGGNIVAATLTSMNATGTDGTDATTNYLFAPVIAPANSNLGVGTLGGNVTANSLKLSPGTQAFFTTLNTGANTITLTSGGLIVTNASGNGVGTLPYSLLPLQTNDNTAPSVRLSGTGLISSSTPGTPLYIYTNRPTFIENPLVGDATTRLVKAGYGTLSISAASTMEGVTVNGGDLVLTGNATLAAGNLSLNNGGSLVAGGTITRTIGTGSGQVSFGAGGGGFGATQAGLTLALTGSGAGGAITRSDVGGNLILTNIHSATGTTNLTSAVDTTGDLILSVGRPEGGNASGNYSNDGAGFAVVSGATSGTGALTLLGPTSAATANTAPGGLIYLKGALGHTGGLGVSGTTVYLGGNSSYLATTNLNLSGGATLAANGTNAYTVGNGAGTISFSATGSTQVPDSGGFSAIGGANSVTLNGGAPLTFDDPGINPFHLNSINLGSALSTHETTLTNNLTAGAADTINVVTFGPQVNRLTGTVTHNGVGLNTTALTISGVGTLAFTGTGSNYGGALTVGSGVLLKVGSAAAFGDATATKIINVGNIAAIDLAGVSNTSTTHSWALGNFHPVATLFNSDTVNTSTISGTVTANNFISAAMIGGPGNLNFEGAVQNSVNANGGAIIFRGAGTYTIRDGFLNQRTGTAVNTSFFGGTVVFDNTTTNAFGTTGNERAITNAFAASVLVLNNGTTFRLLGNNSANTLQNVNNGGVSINNAGNTIEVRSGTGAAQVTTLALGAIARANNGTVNFLETNQGAGTANITTTNANGANGLIGTWATYNGLSYARNDGSGGIQALPDGSYNTTNFVTNTITDVGNNGGPITTAVATSAGMRFNNATNRTLTLTGALAATAAPLGILITDNVDGPTLITGSSISASEIAVHQYETTLANTFTIASTLSGANAVVTKAGPGTLILNNGSNHTGLGARVGQGVIEASVAGALGTGFGSIQLGQGATFRYSGSADYNRIGAGQTTLLGDATIENTGAGKLTLGSTNGYAVLAGNNAYNVTFAGSGNIDVGGIQLGRNEIFEGFGKIIKNGSGTTTLTSSQPGLITAESIVSGGIDINAGTFALGANGAIQAWTPVNINGGTFDNATAISKRGGNIDLTSGGITSTGGGAFSIQALNAAIASGTSTVSAGLSGELAAVTKTGNGTLILSGANTYQDATIVGGGILQVGAGGATGDLSGTSRISVASGATLKTHRDGTLVIAQAITGAGGIEVANVATGITQLTAATNSYTGPTAVSGGQLTLTGSIVGTSSVSLTGGTLLLGGSDRINDSASVTLAGGTFATGGFDEGSATTVGLGALILSASSFLDFGSGSGSQLLFASLGSHTGGTTLSILNWDGPGGIAGGPTDDRLMFAGDDTARLAFLGAFGSSEISFNGTPGFDAIQFDVAHFEIVPIPEPSATALLGGVALFGLVGFRERRRFGFKPRATV